jgi:hypothetical protein
VVQKPSSKTIGLGAIVALVIVALTQLVAVIRDQGWVTRLDDWFVVAVAFLGGLAAILVSEAFKVFSGLGSRKQQLFAEGAVAAVFLGLGLAACITKDDNRLDLDGEIATAAPFVRSLTGVGSSGDRFVITVSPSDSLDVELVVSRGEAAYTAAMDDDRVVRFDRILVGDEWKVTVRPLEGTTGSFNLQVEASDAEEVEIPTNFTASLADERAADGYILELDESGPVFVGVRSLDDGFNPSLEILSTRNLRSAFTVPTDDGWEVFERMPKGEYIITIHAPDRTLGRYELLLDTERADAEEPDELIEPPEGTSVVPNVFDFDSHEAEEVLAEAGFAAVLVDVCSSSVPEGHVRQVYLPDDGGETILVDLPGRPVSNEEIPMGSTLYVKVGTGTACPTSEGTSA